MIISISFKIILPLSGLKIPAIKLIRVVFPLPLSLTVNNKDVMVILDLEDLVGKFQLGPLILI